MDGGERILDFIVEMWVKCPKCASRAIIRNRDIKNFNLQETDPDVPCGR